MELTKTTKWLYTLLALWVTFIFSLGAWWTHLYIKFSDFNVIHSKPEQFYKVTRMLKWEGITVFFGLLAISILIIYIFTRDLKKTNSLKSFFATMTHEMKTPLASIKLQAQVLTDLLEDIDKKSYEKIKPFAERLIEDGNKLEAEMDEILQLARLESGGSLNLEPVNIGAAIRNIIKNYPEYTIKMNSNEEIVFANQYALTLIFRNLIENTKRHQENVKEIQIDIISLGDQIQCTYNDHGNSFKGDLTKLGQLFYRHQSDKGSGLGLYLIKKLMLSQEGQLEIEQHQNLIFKLFFKNAHDDR